MPTIDQLKNCPVCEFQWEGTDIFEEFLRLKKAGDPYYSTKTDAEIEESASHYGWTRKNRKCFSYLVGIEVPEKYDGVSYWQCPNCKCVWDRFTNKRVSWQPSDAKLLNNAEIPSP